MHVCSRIVKVVSTKSIVIISSKDRDPRLYQRLGPRSARGGPRMGFTGPAVVGRRGEDTWRAGVGRGVLGGDVSRPDWSGMRRRRRQVAEVEWGGAESEEEGRWLRQEVGEGV